MCRWFSADESDLLVRLCFSCLPQVEIFFIKSKRNSIQYRKHNVQTRMPNLLQGKTIQEVCVLCFLGWGALFKDLLLFQCRYILPHQGMFGWQGDYCSMHLSTSVGCSKNGSKRTIVCIYSETAFYLTVTVWTRKCLRVIIGGVMP